MCLLGIEQPGFQGNATQSHQCAFQSYHYKYFCFSSDVAWHAMYFPPTGKSFWTLMVHFADSYGKECLSLCVGGYHILHVHLCADGVALISIDVRTCCVNLQDMGDLTTTSCGPQFANTSDHLNDNPGMLLGALVGLRFNMSHKRSDFTQAPDTMCCDPIDNRGPR